MKTGDKVRGITRHPKTGEKFRALLFVQKIIVKTYRVYLDQNNQKIKEELISTNKYDQK